MTKVNLVFNDGFDDVDILAVPDEIASKIEAIGQEFLHWVPHAKDSDYWRIINGEKVANADTDGFIKWLNSNYCANTEKAYVVVAHTNYDPKYERVDF